MNKYITFTFPALTLQKNFSRGYYGHILVVIYAVFNDNSTAHIIK